MRKTLDIDSDVLQAAKELAKKEGKTIGQVLSELARKSLAAGAPVEFTMRNGVPVLPPGGEIITLAHVQKIMDEEGM